MGGGQSYENEYRETQRALEEARNQKIAAEEQRERIQREKESIQAYSRAKETQRQNEESARRFQGENEARAKEVVRAKEETERLQEAQRRLVEKDRALAEKYEKEMQRAYQEREELRRDGERLQKEKERILTENHEKELKRAKEEKARLEEAYRIQAEKDRVLAKKHEEDMRKAKEERERIQKEKDRIQAENHERELKRVKEEKEEALRRAEEEKKRLEETHKMQEECRKLEEKIRREEERRKMEELAKKMEEESKKRVEEEVFLRQEAERNHLAGIPPVKYPTGEEIQAMRKKLEYQEGYLHVAITGVSGSGKSSLINAVRGCSNGQSEAHIAKTGTSETTGEIKRYCDLHPDRPWLVWYDVPGAGTIKIRDWQYFNNQGLYIFNAILIVIGDRFTNTDVELLFHCKRFDIPAFVVRSKADQHIQNNINDDGGCDDDDDDESSGEDRRKNRLMKARDKYTTDTRKDFESLLQTVGLPQQKVYIVDKRILRLLVKNLKAPKDNIDEAELMRDIVHAVSQRHQSFSQ